MVHGPAATQDEAMTNITSRDLRVGDVERSRAEAHLQDAYCDGRLEEFELDQRLGMVMTAQTRGELSASLAGLPPRPRPTVPVVARHPQATGVGAAAHLSGLLTWIFGPLFFYAVASPGTPARREAAKAFNFQLVAGMACIVTAVIGGMILPSSLVGTLMVTGWIGWLILSVMGGARALSGQPFSNPVMKVLRIEPLRTDGR